MVRRFGRALSLNVPIVCAALCTLVYSIGSFLAGILGSGVSGSKGRQAPKQQRFAPLWLRLGPLGGLGLKPALAPAATPGCKSRRTTMSAGGTAFAVTPLHGTRSAGASTRKAGLAASGPAADGADIGQQAQASTSESRSGALPTEQASAPLPAALCEP